MKAGDHSRSVPWFDRALWVLTAGMMPVGAYLGLVVAPPERFMGDVYRIMFVHVPSAWIALIAFTVTLVASVGYLARGGRRWDATAAASAEVGVVFACFLVVTGSLWGRPTWGVYWTWDPRLTTVAITLAGFLGYLALRQYVIQPEQRATWSAVAAIILYANIPLIWFSVRWWNSLHQVQSTPQTVDSAMHLPLRFNALAFLALYLTWVRARTGLLLRRDRVTPNRVAAPAPNATLTTWGEGSQPS